MIADSSEPTLMDLIRQLWSARFVLLLGAALGCVAASLFLVLSVPHYRVTMLVAPAERTVRADIKSFLPENAGFAAHYREGSMAALDAADFTRFEYILRGPSVADSLSRDKPVLDGLSREGKFVFSSAADLNGTDELAHYFRKKIAIEPVGNTPLRRIVYDHPEPEFAIALLNRLYEQADSLIRRDVAAKAEGRAAYLKDMLEKTGHPDHRRVLTSLLMEQEHLLMMLAMEEPFAAIVAEPPAASVRPWWPRKSLIFTGFAFAGALLGFALRHPGTRK